MKEKRFLRLATLFVAVAMTLAVFAGCAPTTKQEGTEATTADKAANEGSESVAVTEPLLEFTFYQNTDPAPAFADPANDVVSQEIEKMFNIRVKEAFYNQGMTLNERLNLFIASNDVPDVVRVINDNVTIPKTGRFAELGDMLKENCPNLMKYYPEEAWKDSLYNGKMYVFPSLFMDGSFPEFADDPYILPFGNWAGIWTTEGLLKKLGYKFTPAADIAKNFNETKKRPTLADFQIEPAIATPDDFYNFLKKIKETVPKVDRKDIIPFTMPLWLEPHFGAMFGLTGQWKYNTDTKKVSQFLGDDKAKEYWQFMNKLYKEGLLDTMSLS